MSQDSTAFPARIDRRLSLFLLTLFVLVVVVGGTSLYFTRVIFISVQEVKKESERLDVINRIHYMVHHLIEEIDNAALHLASFSEDGRAAYFMELRALLERYSKDGAEAVLMTEFSREIGDLDVHSQRVVSRTQETSAIQPPLAELRALGETSARIQALAHGMTAAHRSHMDELVQSNSWKMEVVFWLYGGFVAGGALLIIVSSIFFFRGIAQPLRRLSLAAGEIAAGNRGEKVTVASRDEIGQLSHAFNVMVDRLKENEQELRGMATLKERERIAQELHDTLAQELAVLQIKLNEAEANLPSDAARARDAFEEIHKITGRAYEELRQAIFGLHTMVSKSLGLIPTLTEYLHDYSHMTKIPVSLKVARPEALRFAPDVEVQLIRIVHEALTNVFKHAQARHGTVNLEAADGFGQIMIEDDGRGFVLSDSPDNGLHLGLKTMRERAEAAGGKLTINSVSGKGTQVVVCLPLDERTP
jgi:signal transduction histidine kinase